MIAITSTYIERIILISFTDSYKLHEDISASFGKNCCQCQDHIQISNVHDVKMRLIVLRISSNR